MKLLVVTQYFWPENFKINDLVSEFVARGHDVTVLTGHPSYPDRRGFAAYSKSDLQFREYGGARVVRVPLLARGRGVRLVLNYFSFALSASLLGPWKLRHFHFDAIFVYEPSPITVGLPGIVLRWLRKIPMVFWVQDLWPETLEALGVVKSPRVLGWVGHLVRFIYNRSDAVLAQSQGFIPKIALYCDRPERIVYFPNWAEPLYDEAAASPATEVTADGRLFTVLFAGNIGESQDFPAILDAAERLKDRADIRWIVVGDGRMSDWVSAEVTKRGLAGKVLMVGRFPVERMPSFFLHAQALLVSLRPDPVLSATIPAKLQTYLASGKPILAMIDGEAAEAVRSAGAGLVCAAGDSAGLAAAVARMSELTQTERDLMGDRGKAYAIANFDRTAQLDKLERLLSNLANSRSA